MFSVPKIIEVIKVTDALTVGEILHAQGIYSTSQSARVNAQKKLNQLADLGQIERCNGFYRNLDCKSEFKEHSRLLTKALAEVLKLPIDSIIHREITTPVGLRPDAICLLTKNNQGYCFVLEVLNHETEQYLEQKINTWNNWEGSLEFLSQLFRCKIPHFEILPITVLDGFKAFLREGI
jgi:hypothetical protein